MERYQKARRLCYEGPSDKNYVVSPELTREDFRRIQEAINTNDFSVCSDIVDSLNKTLRDVEKKRVDSKRIEESIDNLWSSYIQDVKKVSPNLTGINGRDWVSVDETENPIFYSDRFYDDAIKAVEELRDFILSKF